MTDSNESLMLRREQAVARGVGQIHPLFIERAENATVWDVEGRQYIDFAGGIAVLNTGHRHPKVIDAVKRQLELYTHTCFQVVAYEPYVALCEKINALVPGDFAKKTLLVTTGAEALENAVKIARAATGRAGVIAFAGGYHGRTMMTLAMTGKTMPYASGMGLMPGGVFRARFPDPLHGVSEDDAIDSIEQIFKTDAEPRDIAALVVEPVQGEGGFRVASAPFMQRLRALCDLHGIVLIADEVQTGAGRTGTFFAMEQMGVSADLTTFAKSVAGGFPLAGVCGRAELMDAIAPGGLGGTYAGNPVACAAALAVLEVFEEENLLVRARTLGDMLTRRLQQLADGDKRITEVRGLGAMVACELMTRGDHPDPELASRLVIKAREKGLILLSCGQYANVIRILVPLT
ncbi:MAG: 4-aminobutyrate--2-oxoglutarate transaminase, partial [Porticoccaceae bacterium]